MCELEALILGFLSELARVNVSAHTLAAYRSDLAQFLKHFAPQPPAPGDFVVADFRDWLRGLHDRRLAITSIRRKLAAVRAFFAFLAREGVIGTNKLRTMRTPKKPVRLPSVMSENEVKCLFDAIATRQIESRTPTRDVAIFEFLYGCGLRVSELVGLNLADVDRTERYLRVRGKGRKERLVPYGAKAAAALDLYLPERKARPVEPALFINNKGGRLKERGVRMVVKLYTTLLMGNSSVHPHSFRHAFATHLLADGADLRAVQELLGHSSLSSTQKYTQLSLTQLIGVYDRTHPKA